MSFFTAEDFPDVTDSDSAADLANAKRDAEIERLRAEIEMISMQRDAALDGSDALADGCARLQADNARLREALEWYASESVWKRVRISGKVDLLGRGPGMDCEVCPAECDAGQKARAALEGRP